MLWIYHGIGERTKSFEPDGKALDHTGGMSMIPTGDKTPSIPYPTLPEDVYDFPRSPTIAAILPVTTSSLPYLSESLSELSTIPNLGEVHLLCPESIANTVRHNLRQFLSRSQGFGHTEFFVTLWRRELSVTESTLQVASSILSNRILILPQDVLAGIDSGSQSILFFGPPSLSVPLGLRGSEVSCRMEFQGFSAARFVVPPLLLPSCLGTTNQSYFHVTSWQELGAHFTQAEGVGGVVPPTTLGNTNGCHDLNASETATLDLDRSNPSLDPNASLLILVAESGDVLALSKLACEFESRGTEVKIIAYGVLTGSIHSAREGCKVAVTHLDPQEPTLHQLFSRSWGVFLTLAEYRLLPESLLEVTARETVIRIPRGDLPHCDWIASLGIRELRGEKLAKCQRLRCSDGCRLARSQGRDFYRYK